MQAVLRSIGWTMIWSGVFLFAFTGYQLWGTGVFTDSQQNAATEELAEQFAEAREQAPDTPSGEEIEIVLDDDGKVVEVVAPDPDPDTPDEPAGPPVLYDLDTPREDRAFAEIKFPTLASRTDAVAGRVEAGDLAQQGLSYAVFAGVELSTLRKGPGWMMDTALPGQPGNAVISGHRTTYGAPFFKLDELRPGDPIIIETALGTNVYVVREPEQIHLDGSYLYQGASDGWISVLPTALWVKNDREGSWITLTACNPKYSARERIIVFAELVSGPNYDFIYGEGA